MRLYLINPSNPLVSIVNVKESRLIRYRVWKPLSLVLAGLSPAEWEFTIGDENLSAPNHEVMRRPAAGAKGECSHAAICIPLP